jgi:hypothetical protein
VQCRDRVQVTVNERTASAMDSASDWYESSPAI